MPLMEILNDILGGIVMRKLFDVIGTIICIACLPVFIFYMVLGGVILKVVLIITCLIGAVIAPILEDHLKDD